VPGVLAVGAVTVLALLLARLLWRWRWFRAAAGLAGAAGVICALAWSLSGVVGP
jgi:competence protein ComEC